MTIKTRNFLIGRSLITNMQLEKTDCEKLSKRIEGNNRKRHESFIIRSKNFKF